jgi:predicted Fe-S protein YdhL (DUF1289 family)
MPTYDELSSQLRARFSSENKPSDYVTLLHNRKRRVNEGIHELTQGILELACRAYPTMDHETRKSMCTDIFVWSLLDEDQRKAVWLASPKSIDDAAQTAIAWESAERMEKRRQVVPNKKSVRAVTLPEEEESRGKKQSKWSKKWKKGNVSESSDDDDKKSSRSWRSNEKKATSNTQPHVAAVQVPFDAEEITKTLKAVVDSMAALTKKVEQQNTSNHKPFVRQSSPKPTTFGRNQPWAPGCFTCGDVNHFRRDCPKQRHFVGNTGYTRPQQQGNGQGRGQSGQQSTGQQ